VRLALAGKHGSLRILDEGPRAAFHIPGSQGLGDAWGKGRTARYELEVDQVQIDRLAQLPTQWPRRDYVANTLELRAHAHTVPCKTEDGIVASPKDGADIELGGELLDYWDRPYDGQWNLTLDVKNFGPTLRTCIKPKMGGDNLGGTVKITGPFLAMPKVTLDLHGLDFDVTLSAKEEPLRLTLAEVHGDIDLVDEQGTIEKTKALVQGGKEPGEVMVSATFGLKPYNAHASIDITKCIDVGRFLPKPVATSVGKFACGKMTVGGDTEAGFELKDFDLSLGQTPSPKDRALHVYSGRVFAQNDFADIDIQKVRIEANKSHALVDGGLAYVEPDGYQYKRLEIRGEFPDLDVWLKRFGLPPIATSAGGGPGGDSVIILNGPITQPRINVSTTLAGIPCIDTMRIENATVSRGIVDFTLSSSGLGGELKGSGVIDTNAKPAVLQSLHVGGKRLDGEKLCGLKGVVKGTIDSATVDLKNASINPKRSATEWLAFVKADASAKKLSLLGDRYSDLAVCLNRTTDDDDKLCRPWDAYLDEDDRTECELAKKGGFCLVTSATRDAGGRVDATIANVPAIKTARHGTPGHLGGSVAVDLPLAALDQLVGGNTIGGVLAATLHLQGDVANGIQADGTMYLLRTWVLGAFVGDSQLQVDPTTVGPHRVPGLLIHGTTLGGNLDVTAEVGTQAPFPVKLVVQGRRLELDPFIDVSKKLGFPEPIEAWMTGAVTINTELAPLDGKPAKPEAWVEVTELEGIVEHRTDDGRLTPLRFALVPRPKGEFAMSLRVTPSTIELACRDVTAPNGRKPCPASLETPAGIVSIEGNATQSQMALFAHGDLQLRRLAPLFENQVESIDGKVRLAAKVTGTFKLPTYEVSLDLDNATLRPAGGDTVLEATTGQIMLSNGTIGFQNVTLRVRDERRAEEGELHVAGAIGLDGLTPARWGLLVDGTIAGKMLLVFAPGFVSQASGLAWIDGSLQLAGTGALPQINGTITFDPPEGQTAKTPFAVIPRGVRRELALLAGSIEIETSTIGAQRRYALRFDDSPLTASIDSEGKIENIHGNVVFQDGKPSSAEIDLDAENIPFRMPGKLDLTLAAKDIRLKLPSASAVWQASGKIAIVNGRYFRNFELAEALKPAPAAVAPAKTFWDEYQPIGNAELALQLEVRKFSVDNNIAKIDLEGPRILISGSPRDVRMSGSIKVQRGEFKIPGTRANFTRTTGTIDFAENDKADNPKLDIASDAPDYLDLSGQLHTITLTLFGSLDQPQFDLKTSTGYNKSQTLSLLFLGRNPEQLRRSLGDQSLGSDPLHVDPTTNPSTGFADQIVKDLAGSWVSGLVGGSLTRLTGVDVLRFELGFGSVAAHAEKRVLENVRLIGDFEQTIRGQTINPRVEVRTPIHINVITNDTFTLNAGHLSKNFYDPAEPDISEWQAKLVYRLFIP
jgi:hypothetical protein